VNVTWVLAWRNLWRHRRRTWLTVGAMVFCNILLVFLVSLQLGAYQMMIDGSLAAYTGHIQVQKQGYLDDQYIYQSVPEVTGLAAQVRAELGVDTVAARAEAFALASSAERSFGIMLTGVQSAYEPGVSTFPGKLREGRYLADDNAQEIVIGAVLAENLKVGVGDELTFLGSGRDGSFAAAVATVVGILDTGLEEVDRSMAQVPLGWFQQVFSMGNHGHSVVVRLPSLERVPAAALALRDQLRNRDELTVLDWDALMPGLRQAIDSDMASAWFQYAILVVLVAFSVLNTQLMSVLERTREFGVMLSLGLRPQRLAHLVGMETLLLAIIGMVLGMLGGGLLSWYLSYAGFSYPGMEEMAARFMLPDRMYPEVSLLSMSVGPLAVFGGAMLAALYPALRLFRLQPVAAMKEA
jgi:ABC-type lipoprotein release transport system permease subunit